MEMIISKYLPNIEFVNDMNSESKIEVPADFYEATINKFENCIKNGVIVGINYPAEAKNFILCGAYNYDVAKIIALSEIVEALKFNNSNGEVVSKSKVGISAEITLAFAIWNGYDYNTAIERAILSRLSIGANFLPPILSEFVEQIKINDGIKINQDIAKNLVEDSTDFVSDYFIEFAEVDDVSISENRYFKDEIIFVFKAKNDVADLFRRKISIEQFVKNITVKIAGTAAFSVGSVAGIYASGDPILALEAAKLSRIMAIEKTKNFLDKFITDDSQEMLNIIGEKLAELLNGQFLTQYEMEVLMEILRDDYDEGVLKEMYACGDNQARMIWAEQYLSERLQRIFSQREFIRMPSNQEWTEGFQRLMNKLNNGEDIVSDMEQLRYNSLSNLRGVIGYYGLKSYEIGTVIQSSNDMKKSQVGMERAIEKIQTDEYEIEKIKSQQQRKFNRLMSDLKNLSKRR